MATNKQAAYKERAEQAEARENEANLAYKRMSDARDEVLSALKQAEARLREVVRVGHNDDCIFCGFKDRIASGEEAKRLAAAQPEEGSR